MCIFIFGIFIYSMACVRFVYNVLWKISYFRWISPLQFLYFVLYFLPWTKFFRLIIHSLEWTCLKGEVNSLIRYSIIFIQFCFLFVVEIFRSVTSFHIKFLSSFHCGVMKVFSLSLSLSTHSSFYLKSFVNGMDGMDANGWVYNVRIDKNLCIGI